MWCWQVDRWRKSVFFFLLFFLASVATYSVFAAESLYVVKKGDTLTQIAARHGTSVLELARLNRINVGSVLKIGQKLKLPQNLPPTESAQDKKQTLPSEKKPVKQGHPLEVATPKILVENRESSHPSVVDESYFLKRVKDQIDLPKVKKGHWKYIVIHHSGSLQGSGKIFDTYHRSRGMENGLAYHFVIGNGTDTKDGEIEVGARWLQQIQGGHLFSEYLNTISIGICFVGNFNSNRPSARQVAACLDLVDYLKRITEPPEVRFCLHREINPRPTDCPGKQFPSVFFHKRLD